MRFAKQLVFLSMFIFAFSQIVFSQKKTPKPMLSDKTRVLLILDCSNSMWDKWQSDSKIKITQTVLLKFLDSIANQNDIEVALRVFGHLNKKSYGTRLEVPFENGNFYKLRSKIKTLVPQGGCEAASALSNSLNDFPGAGNSRNLILIITDGMDDCDGAICSVAKQVQESGVITKTFILGIGNKQNFQNNLNCAGKFIYVSNEEEYTQTLYDIFSLSEEKANVVLRIKDKQGRIYETTVPIIFFDAQTDVAKYQTLYSTETKYEPDFFSVDPLLKYNVVAYTKPPIYINNIMFDYNKKNDLTIEAEQGYLNVHYEPKRTSYQIPEYPVVIRKSKTFEILNIQNINTQVAYLAGLYDIEILSTPIIKLKDVEIKHVANTDLSIPTPGAANITKPKAITIGSIFTITGNTWEYVCDLDENKTFERILLMPGDYTIILKPKTATAYSSVNTQKFRIDAGQITNISFK